MSALRKSFAALLCAALLAPAQARAEQEPLTLKPSSDWVLDYAENSCALRRAFGEGEQKAFLELDNFALWDTFRVTVMEEGIGFHRRAPRTRFEPETKLTRQYGVLYGVFAEGRQGVLYTDSLLRQDQLDKLQDLARRDLPPVVWSDDERDKREREVTALFVADTFDRDLRLETGSLHAPMNAMRTCLTDLMTHLGIDAEKMRTISKPVVSRHMATWVEQFVGRMLGSKLMRQGRTLLQVRLIVDEQGKPTNCYARDEGQDESFAKLSCDRLLEVAEFDPALDAQGRPMRAAWTTRIVFSP